MKYLHLFETVSAFTENRSGNYEEPWASYTVENDKVDYNKTEDERLLDTPLTFEIISDGNIVWKCFHSAAPKKVIEYKKNDGEWTTITPSTGGTALNVTNGDILQFRGNNTSYGNSSPSLCVGFSGSTARFNAYGNIMSLVDSDDFSDLKSFTDTHVFDNLFIYSPIESAEKLLLPATGLMDSCYSQMFIGCSRLISAPKLPGTTLASWCYNQMFLNCTSLTSAPILMAETLPASCYREMFRGCTNLRYVKCLATDISGNNSTFQWLTDVASSGTFVKAASMSSWLSGTSGIPTNWTVQDA